MRLEATYLLVTSCLATLGAATPPTQLERQQPVLDPQVLPSRKRVPGTNNATYGSVPTFNQLFEIEYLEIAPSPIEV